MTGRVLITGAAGFIGGHVSRGFLEEGWSVTGFDSFDPFYDRSVKEEGVAVLCEYDAFKLLEGDIRDDVVMREAVSGVDLVVHLAALVGVRSSTAAPERYVSVNVGGTTTVLEACRIAGVKHVVFGSSSSVYGDTTPAPFREDALVADPISPYAATKRAGELLCRVYSHLYGFRVAALRFFTVYGARQRPDLAIHKFTRLIASGETVPQYGDGTSERDYTHVDDIVQGVMAAARWTCGQGAAFEIVNLGESRTVELRSLIELIGKNLGVEPRVEVRDSVPGDVVRTCADITKAKDMLGYSPCVSIEDGIYRFVEWFKASYACAA